MNKKQTSIMNVGSTSLMMIFIVLCLVTFAVLSLSSAANDHHLTQMIVNRTDAYYQASGKAETVLSQLDQIFAEVHSQTSEEAFIQQVFSETSALSTALVLDEENQQISYQVPITDRQILSVTIQVTYPTEPDDTFYKILQWQSVESASPL